MAAGVVSLAAYLIYALGKSAPEAGNLKAWAAAMLVFIGISIAFQVITQILFHIIAAAGIAAKEREKNGDTVERIIKSELADDERDKRISLRAVHIGYICAGIGIIAALAVLALGALAVTALHIIIGSCFVSSFVEGAVNIYLYERGR